MKFNKLMPLESIPLEGILPVWLQGNEGVTEDPRLYPNYLVSILGVLLKIVTDVTSPGYQSSTDKAPL